MNLLLYANGRSGTGERLRNAIKSIVPEKQTEICPTFDSLLRKLRRPMHGVEVAVLLAGNTNALWELYSIKECFEDIQTILILPDKEAQTVSIGHKFYPRFLNYTDSDFKVVAAVLKKILENSLSVKRQQQRLAEAY